MKVTSVTIRHLSAPKNSLIAFATIVLDEILLLTDFQIFAIKNKYFVGMPTRKLPNGDWQETVVCLDACLLDQIKSTILRVFEDELAINALEKPH